jgi:arginine decarboxylase
METRAPLYDKLMEFAARRNRSFHVPGHKHGRAYEEQSMFTQLLRLDVTELPGFDDLHQAHDVIAEAQRLAAHQFSAEETFFLVNGSTVGNLALVMTACAPGDVVLVQRNAHKSVLHGLMLAGANAVFLMPEVDDQTGTALGLRKQTIEQALRDYPQAKALYLTNPTYYGASIDLAEMAALVHQAGKMLLVDEAHGAHFGFHPAWPKSAMQCGADGAVQSTHKMLTSMTMSGMLHVQGSRLNREKLRKMLTMLQSSSPSYVLMASLDLARARLAKQGIEPFQRLQGAIFTFRQRLRASFGEKVRWVELATLYDPCKIMLQVPGMSGYELQCKLADEGCFVELADHRQILLALSLETNDTDFEQLLAALKIVVSQSIRSTTNSQYSGIIYAEQSNPISFSHSDNSVEHASEVQLTDALGMICAEAAIPYPPGIPLLFPGECIEMQHIEALSAIIRSGGRVHGLNVRDEQLFIRVRYDIDRWVGGKL